jgi:ABC-type branched-subunit amino acid transport system ATPase component
MALLEAEGIISGYDSMEVLHGVSLRVEPGQIVVVLGPNGAGKSTLMKTLFGLLRPRSGRITFDGREISGLPPEYLVRLGMSYVPQEENVFTTLTVEENLEMGAFILEGDLRQAQERVFELFPVLRERRRQQVGKMSGGERQMVAIGRALMLDPKLLLLDEPSAGLAPKLVELIFERICKIKESGVAIVMVEQDIHRALKLADRAYVLANGCNRFEGSARELRESPDIVRFYLQG